ncbi:NAD(+) diphosphatase [Fulvivirga sp. 29W222]|uniref:NAD(+) diphosphatase n=1 Tax=Fulvivirga marina TaxID=2494733 RepID=A0A937FXL1_9BACT|nr:NAD(+) diphosphatase [Fulvivirga marina]MBL6447984.1 NAD(+) diphosphatase [Fulvivirga marina]
MEMKLYYCHNQIDRAGNLRKDEVWLSGQLKSPQALLMPYWRSKSLLSADHSSLGYLLLRQSEHVFSAASETIFLGLDNDRPIFAADLSCHELEEASQLVGIGEFQDLRKVAPQLSQEQASLAAYARGLMQWHKSHAFCSHCGSRSAVIQGGHARECANEACKTMCFPRLDPAIITLIEHIPEHGDPVCLLGVHDTPSGRFCTTLAGFVEPGETLEGAVEREMMEEVGLVVKDIRYVASQPWPFPASIMIGFTAKSDSLKFTLDKDEVPNAAWFTAKELLDASKAKKFSLSKTDSIARFLIENWIYKNIS